MRRLIPFMLLIGCSEYEVHRLGPGESKKEDNWFDNASMDDGSRGSEDDSEDDESWDSEDDEDDSWREGDDSEDDSEDDSQDGSEDSSDDDSSDDYWGDEDSEDESGGGSGSSGGSSGGSSAGPGESSSSARRPSVGEVVITELMIDPDSVADQQGEWLEIKNNTSHWLDLTEYRLADGGRDDMEIAPVSSGSMVMPPGGYIVLCAESDYWDNGGVECHGTFRWWTFGDGFAMSNTEDEVLLTDDWGVILDRVHWTEGFVVVGGSLGLDPDEHSTTRNDNLDLWCEQWSWLPFGDSGTPGEDNDPCW